MAPDYDIKNVLSTQAFPGHSLGTSVSTDKYRNALLDSFEDAESAFATYLDLDSDSSYMQDRYSDSKGSYKRYSQWEHWHGTTIVNRKFHDVITSVYDYVRNGGDVKTIIETSARGGYSHNSFSYDSENLPLYVNNRDDSNYCRFQYGNNVLIAGLDLDANGGGVGFDYTLAVRVDSSGNVVYSDEQIPGGSIVSNFNRGQNGELVSQKNDVKTRDEDFTRYVEHDFLGRESKIYIDKHSNDDIQDAWDVVKFFASLLNDDEDLIYTIDYLPDGRTVVSDPQRTYFTTEMKNLLEEQF